MDVQIASEKKTFQAKKLNNVKDGGRRVEKIKEEFSVDPLDCCLVEKGVFEEVRSKKMNVEFRNELDKNGHTEQKPVGDCSNKMASESSPAQKEIEKILIKEEIIKEELMEDPNPPIEDEEMHYPRNENRLAETSSEMLLKNYLQKEIECSLLNNEELRFLPANLGMLQCNHGGNLELCLKKHNGNKPFKCSFCSYETARKTHLTDHLRTHSGEKPFKCTSCPYRTAHRKALQAHIRTHTGEKPFKCSLCSYKSAHSSTLRMHLRTHTGEKPFKCNSCSYQAARKHHLRRHLKTHTGEKPFKCNLCPYEAARKSHLEDHLRMHSREKPFKCSSCPYQSAYRSGLGKHIKKHHFLKTITLD